MVAGADGSPASLTAAEYAADVAVRRGLPLELVHGYLHPFRYGVPLDPYPVELPLPNQEAQRMLDLAAVLIDAADRADLVVVGSRGHGGFAGLLLGSVGAQVAAHARGPVLVVRPGIAPRGPVTVGVDGSPGSGHALAYAAEEAALRSGELLLVHVWWTGDLDEVRETYEETEKAARAAAEDVLSAATATVRRAHPGLAVGWRLIHGLQPDRHLVEVSREAALIAVGSRGRGGFSGAAARLGQPDAGAPRALPCPGRASAHRVGLSVHCARAPVTGHGPAALPVFDRRDIAAH
ncbi:universal stress protein [Phytohabitans rumicis]|uniref:Universal stress protein n=1 Tax=Phytohabitans rumicis TaxID=1076125 RepID=A0A6V8LPU3_9ACTN|nr:universal stress protein [Phytohabitans rumicis]